MLLIGRSILPLVPPVPDRILAKPVMQTGVLSLRQCLKSVHYSMSMVCLPLDISRPVIKLTAIW